MPEATMYDYYTTEDICYLCGEKLEWPTPENPMFVDDTTVTSKCKHYVKKHEATR